MPIVHCGWCNKEIRVIPAKLRPINFCSRQCSGKYRTGKLFHAAEAKARISNKLMGGKSPGTAAYARTRTGENHPRWGGNSITKHAGRHRAQARFDLKPCEVCGCPPGGHKVHRHHKDENTLNNEPDNISFLCTKHHGEAHARLRKEKKLCHL